MTFVVRDFKREELKKQIPVLRMEIDYELLTLYDALQAEDEQQIIKTKKRLSCLREQLIKANEDIKN